MGEPPKEAGASPPEEGGPHKRGGQRGNGRNVGGAPGGTGAAPGEMGNGIELEGIVDKEKVKKDAMYQAHGFDEYISEYLVSLNRLKHKNYLSFPTILS